MRCDGFAKFNEAMRVKCNAEGSAASTARVAAGSNDEVNRFGDFEVWWVGKHFFDGRKI